MCTPMPALFAADLIFGTEVSIDSSVEEHVQKDASLSKGLAVSDVALY